jgi:hypothetical protein
MESLPPIFLVKVLPPDLSFRTLDVTYLRV